MKRILTVMLSCCVVFGAYAAIKYFTDYPSIATPPDNFAAPLDTQLHGAGQIPYNFWTISQQKTFWSAFFSGQFLPTITGNGTNETFWGTLPVNPNGTTPGAVQYFDWGTSNAPDSAPTAGTISGIVGQVTNYQTVVINGKLMAYWSDGVTLYSKQLAP